MRAMWNTWRRTEIHGEFWRGNPKEIFDWEDLGVREKINLKYLLQYKDVMACIGLIWVKAGPPEHGNKLSGSIK